MAYQVLARKYRPQRFADVAGQDHVTVTLMNALTQNRIAHGYIFSGHRGIGKTTIARILACALNCRNPIGSEIRPTAEPCEVCESCTEIRAGNSVDVIEIDAATNRGIDDIRELRDAARYAPARDKYKIILLDEAHQITDAAFNALLKTLEEPPDHIVFMMATTQPEDIPQTVRSRCQHFSFHAVKLADILGELRGIAAHEGVDADEAALSLLAEAGDGSMRDALSIMDQAIASAPLSDGKARLDAAQIRELMGAVPNATFERILAAVDDNNSADVITIANDLLDAGNSPSQLARQAVRYLRSCVIAKITGLTPDGENHTELLQISPEEQRRAARTAALFTEEELTRFLQTMLRTFDELGYRQEQRFHFELGLLKLVHLRRLLPVEQLLSSIGPAASVQRPSSAPTHPGSGPLSVPRLAAVPPSHPPASAKPAFSPFEQNTNRNKYDNVPSGHTSTPQTPTSSGANALASTPAPVSAAQPVLHPVAVAPSPVPVAAPIPVAAPVAVAPPLPVAPPLQTIAAESVPEFTGIPHVASDPAQAQAPVSGDDSHLQRSIVDALQSAGQGSAADAIEDSTITVQNGEARIQTRLSKTLLPVTLNPEAEKILKAALRTHGVLKHTLHTGAPTANASRKPRAAKSGSAQAKAEQHPLVQQARKLFDAELQQVIDLSEDA
jgi:DNA polymerase-3 subunit gamma/tau